MADQQDQFRGYPLQELRHEPDEAHSPFVHGWQREDLDKGLILFYNLNKRLTPDRGNGFDFIAVEWSGGDERGDLYMPLVFGSAYFDGMRHLYFGHGEYGDSLGYLYCADLPKILKALNRIRELEAQHCPDAE